MYKVVVLTGAGISADSGLATFRDSGGLWEGYDINEVATLDGWYRDQQKVLDFYNLRRKQAAEAQPNAAHKALKDMEAHFDVSIITQNVDDLHERAGSKNVLHLHGELRKACSVDDRSVSIDIGSKPIKLGDKAPDGKQLRPDIIWFGEMVPMIEPASVIMQDADIVVVIGTSLVVYPAAGLVDYSRKAIYKAIVDPSTPELRSFDDWEHFKEKAAKGTPELVNKLIKDFSTKL
jgi:NAD-dependent deacetylase